MQRKFMNFFTVIVLFSLLIAPAGTAQASAQQSSPECPPYKAGFLQDKGFLATLTPECIRTYKEEAAQQAALPAAADVALATIGGPDNFGYTYNSAAAYNWINATTNSGLTGDDKSSGPIDIGFNFPFYGSVQTQLYFNTNGLITFGAGTPQWGAYTIPDELNPNNFIAAFWDDLLVGSPYNSGAIFYAKGGTAPNRYIVIEWRNVENYAGTGVFSFEAILAEKGDIIIQHKSQPSAYFSTVGIEDSTGYQGLQYQFGSSGIGTPKSIRFYYPASAARILAYPSERGGFVPLTSPKDFSIVVKNTGSQGADTYDLTTFTSAWPVSYYASDGTTLLIDTDGDTVIDTGPIPQGGSTTVIARYRVLPGTVVGDSNVDQIRFASSLNNAVIATVRIYMSVPAAFASVFVDNANGAMSFFTASSGGTNLKKATADDYFGTDVAVAQLTNGNYFYAWDNGYTVGNSWARDIEYVLLNRAGGIVRAPTKLTNNATASKLTLDSLPSVAVAPDGTVGVVWRRYIFDDSTDKFNYNILFATLNAAGTLLNGPINITNNSKWGTSSTIDLPQYYSPSIGATTNKTFIIAWEEDRRVSSSNFAYNVQLAARNTAGTNLHTPFDLTENDTNWDPVVNSLANGKAIVTWRTKDKGPYYAVINSSGSIHTSATNLGSGTTYGLADAVALPNGKAAVAWTTDSGVQFSVLNSSFAIETGPHTAASPSSTPGRNISVTTDAASHVIMSWIDKNNSSKQFYALGTSNGEYLTAPMYYNSSKDGLSVSWNGQGIAPFTGNPVISGNVGVAGATLNYTGGSTTSDSFGNYAFIVPFGWSGTVTPSKAGYIFSPTKRTYSNVTTDLTTQNYTATPVNLISGNVGVTNVALSFTDGSPRTVRSQPNGDYAFYVSENWTGTVTPTHSCFTFNPASRSYTNLTDDQTSQDYTPSVKAGCADVDVNIHGVNRGRYGVPAAASMRLSYANVDSGPVEIASNNSEPLIGAERVIYKVNNVATSYSEMMALPNSQVDKIYWLPWYNSKDLDTQIRFANVSNSDATVHVSIGGTPVTGSPFTVAAGASRRLSFPGIDKGPVRIESNQDIVASERVIYKVNNVSTSFSEMMALPDNQLDTIYWLPWYNSKDLDTQLRIANVSASDATVHVSIGGTPVTGSPFTILAGKSIRKSFPGIDKGPVRIESNQNVVAAERVIYKVNNLPVSFSETMALPNTSVDTTYWLPWYNSKDLDSQLRIANVSASDATVHVRIGGVEVAGSPFTIAAGASKRLTLPGIDKGPVEIESNVDIVAAERVIYKVNNVPTSFSEMMALPNGLLDIGYWLPWYNSKDLDTQLRFGNP